MQLLFDLDQIPEEWRRGALAIGKFDGVHRGHEAIIRRLCSKAKEIGGPAIAFTFSPLPIKILAPAKAGPPLTWIERRAELLGQLGVDGVIAYPTDHEMLGWSARYFFDWVIRDRLDAQAMIEGYNFCFGHKREGDVVLLQKYCDESGIDLEVIRPVQVDEERVSSSRVRRLILEGDIAAANRLMTQPYRIRGLVVGGDRRGRELGYPTANLQVIDTQLPAEAVYYGRGWLGDRCWPAAISIGPNPTFSVSDLKVEVHLIGFQGDLYDQTLELELLGKLREIEKYNTVQELLDQLHADVEIIKDRLTQADE